MMLDDNNNNDDDNTKEKSVKSDHDADIVFGDYYDNDFDDFENETESSMHLMIFQ